MAKPPWYVCVHEAGHVVASIKLGNGFVYAYVLPGRVKIEGVKGQTITRETPNRTKKDRENNIVSDLAGIAAERVFGIYKQGTQWGDLSLLISLMPAWNLDYGTDLDYDTQLARATRLIKKHRKEVERAARLLQEKGQITEEDVKQC